MARPESMGLIPWEGDREPHPQGGVRRRDGRGAEGRWLAEAAVDKGLLYEARLLGACPGHGEQATGSPQS